MSSLDWLLIHPTGEGPYVDSVFLVFGDVVVQIGVTVVETGRDHRQVIEAADEVAHRAVG